MKRSSFHTLSLAVLLTALGPAAAHAATVNDAKRGVAVQAPAQGQAQAAPQPRVALPARTDVLAVDWVDTRNAKIAIGGITYALKGTLPNIVLSSGEQVTNIGYLKSGMQVRIRTSPDSSGPARLIEITVAS